MGSVKTVGSGVADFIYTPWLFLLLVGYCVATQLFKGVNMRKFGEWL